MEAPPTTAARISIYPLEERAGAGRHELSLPLADPSVLDALPPHVRARVQAILVDPKPAFEILRDGTVHPPYAVVTQMESAGTVDRTFDQYRFDISQTFDSSRKPASLDEDWRHTA